MPNHVTNIISFKGSTKDIEELRDKIQSIDEKEGIQEIDFSKIIPMPDSMKITSGSQVDTGIAILLFTEKGDSSRLDKMLDYAWVKAENITNAKQLSQYLIKNNRANLKEARIALDNLEKYGYQDWYSWSVANWGTKWNAYSAHSTDDGIKFDTAWSTPFPVIQKLSEMFPNVEITLRFADEDFGHNCGEIVFLAGEAEENLPEEGSTKALILATKIQENSLDELMYYSSSENDEFVGSLLSAMIEMFSVEEVVDEMENAEFEIPSEIFLTTLKEELINAECYELIGRVDKKINELEKEGEE